MSLLAYCFSRLTESKNKHKLKGFKVTDVNRTRKFGVACRSLQELKRKACGKLNITNDLAEINMYLLDGSLIDEEFFHTLDNQTAVVLQRPGEKLLSDADLLYETLKQVNIDYLTAGEQASKFLSDNLKRKIAILHSVLNRDDSKTTLSRREDHPEWFRGLETNITTKEAYMHRRCQDRIRSYLYKTIEQIKASETWANNQQARLHLHRIIEYFKLQLKEDHYFGYYFDRSRSFSDESKQCSDQVDGANDNCYDHCPCKLNKIEITEEFSDDIIHSKDEIDAKRISTADSRHSKRLAVDESEISPYVVFSREKEEQYALCDAMGEFRCEGIWHAKSCAYGDRHRINPYRSREELILFSTWNLDHK
ncbi:DNA fragmentation factor subunit beta isoform X2 [Chelonus insularis]|nr:DNA fragmentation factor subunit beta isoform X2 [Chelonus insularis]